MSDRAVIAIDIGEGKTKFSTPIESAIREAESDLFIVQETVDSLQGIKPECDRIDYALAASAGALCGIVDIFLVGKPGESPIGDLTDSWFEDRVVDFAKLCNTDKDRDISSTSSAIKFLEDKFKIPYDQRGAGDAGKDVYDLTPKNHHFKSLGHNPTIAGLFFSILDQFTDRSHFISAGKMPSLEKASVGDFELKGHNIPSKLFCGFINWFGHLISDVSGSSGSMARGMGIPSPIWSWTNDIIAIKAKLDIPVSEFDKTINELALEIYTEGYDARFQTAQLIPVFLNELLVRFIYSLRRIIRYFASNGKEDHSFKKIWEYFKPYGNATVKRMLTVAHGTFCLMDIGDATYRGIIAGAGTFNPVEFVLRLNVPGLGRFAISLYGEGRRAAGLFRANADQDYAYGEKEILQNYLEGLRELSRLYDDQDILQFVNDLKTSDAYINAFENSVKLAELRKVPDEKIIRSKKDIDNYFMPGGESANGNKNQ